MKKPRHRWKWICFVLMASLIAGCATYGRDLVEDKTVNIETVSSRWAKVTRVMVNQEDAGIVVRGEVQRWPPMRGPIPGHVVVEVIGPNGKSLKTVSADYHRLSVKSRTATFNTRFETIPPRNSVVRVTHVWGD